MADDRRWMYDGFDKTRGKAHSVEWRKKTHAFINHAFAGKTHYLDQVRCPCNEHNNGKFVTKEELTKDMVNYGFMPAYETWSFHGEKETRVETEVEADNSAGVDRMDEMLEALQPEFGLNSEDPPAKEVEEFFKLLQASERRRAKYGKEMERRHGEGFDWRNAPVDPQAVYDSGAGKSHGRYSMFNGMIDSRQVQRGSSSQSSGSSSSR
ncbi:hypothetical protein U9M48_001353 [Paspalum notatum var. saurae]|uniref:Transposase-associated domain-containing protein n=1 Tax=Paspalum notatum var. saurae TaxID=547442 RepID=A0AAQ3SIW1_PASNO